MSEMSLSESDWDDDYYPNLPRPRFRSPHRHFERSFAQKSESEAAYGHHDQPAAANKIRKYPTIKVLNIGHSKKFEKTGDMFANCTVTFIRGVKFNMLVDTMTAWDGEKLERLLKEIHVKPEDIHYVICTHGHSDHTGCNYLFRDAFHFVGKTMSHGERYISTPIDHGDEFLIEPKVKIISTPGHTLDSVSVLVETGPDELGLVAITGDLFEREADIEFPELWREAAGSEDPKLQEENRNKILQLADYIVPGHGHMFQNNYKNLSKYTETEEPEVESFIAPKKLHHKHTETESQEIGSCQEFGAVVEPPHPHHEHTETESQEIGAFITPQHPHHTHHKHTETQFFHSSN